MEWPTSALTACLTFIIDIAKITAEVYVQIFYLFLQKMCYGYSLELLANNILF